MTEEHICQKYKESPAEKTAFRKAANDIFVRALRMLLCAALLLSVSACGRKNPNGEDSRKEVGGADSAEGAEGMETVTGSESDGFGGVLGTEIAAADYEMTDEAAVNPYIGFAVDAESKDAASGYSLVYIDITFRELQPESPDKFDFETIAEKNNIERWKMEGKHAVLRFVCDIPDDNLMHKDIPDWLFDLTGDGTFYDTSYGKGYSPNYGSEIFIKYHEAAVRALGEYFSDGFVSYVELGSLGHWGEWHIKREDGIVGMPEKSVRDEYVKHYVSAFSGAKLMMRRPFSSAEEYGLGLFNDMAGDPEATDEWLGWIENGGEYTQTGEADALSPMPEFWKTSPSGGELTSSLEMEYLCGEGLSQTLELLKRSHTTFKGPKCPVSSSDKYDGEPYVGAVPEMLKSIGYRIGITRMRITVLNGVYKIELEWRNDGCAPIYFKTPVCLYLTDDSGVQEMIAETDIDLTVLMPGETMYSVTELPGGVSFENKTLSVGLIDPMTGKPAVKLISNQKLISHQQTDSDMLAELYRFS